MSPVHVVFEIKPLTHTRKDGVVYERRTEVISQIEELSNVSNEVLFSRIRVEQEDQPNSIKSETLVFLHRQASSDYLRNAVVETLALRIKRLVGSYRQWFRNPQADFDDFLADVNMVVFLRICDPSDKGDYAQVSFGQWVVYIANNIYRKYEKLDKIKDKSDSTDEDPNDPDHRGPLVVVPDRKISVDKRLLLDEAINSIQDVHHRNAYISYHVDGYQIESKDPKVPTLAKIYNKTGRTIRNWLAKAEKDIEVWNGGLK